MLNALRHQWLGHGRCMTGSVSARVVLNALRHQWLGHAIISFQAAFSFWAQRLTASMVGARSPQLLLQLGTWCSTPYGINGWGTVYVKGLTNSGMVLNALRHQWLGHWEAWAYRCGAEGRVLNALRHQWLGHGYSVSSPPPQSTSAQRLTASMVGAPLSAFFLMREICVLNALRHQWLGHQKHGQSI